MATYALLPDSLTYDLGEQRLSIGSVDFNYISLRRAKGDSNRSRANHHYQSDTVPTD